MTDRLRRSLSILASLRLTVVLLAMLMVLIFVGTWAQRTAGIWQVMDRYFTSWGVWVPLSIFAPAGRELPGGFPFPGGATLALAILVNLIAAHTARFKLKVRGARLIAGILVLIAGALIITWFQSWGVIGQLKAAVGVAGMLAVASVAYLPAIIGTWLLFGRRVGIVLIHGSLILLIVGEMVTRGTAIETQMPIYEGQTQYWTHDIREVELALTRPLGGPSDGEQVIVFPQPLIEQAAADGQPLTHPDLPAAIRVDRFMPNSLLAPRADEAAAPAGTTGLARRMELVERPPATGVGDLTLDLPGAWITVLDPGGALIGRYAVTAFTSVMGDAHRTIRQNLELDGTTWQVDLRFRRHYRPVGFRLDKFSHDLYPGTRIPRNFASDIRILEPGDTEGRDVHIRMNQPLRFRGETYFQSAYIPDPAGGADLGTVLQVVRNPASTMPYIACGLGGMGLLIHFLLSLWRYTARSTAGRHPQ